MSEMNEPRMQRLILKLIIHCVLALLYFYEVVFLSSINRTSVVSVNRSNPDFKYISFAESDSSVTK